MQKEKEMWYAEWFNTPYYHILYKDRDYQEAGAFMQRLTSFLQLQKGDTILDLACGKGRHSKFLNTLGFNVTGVDLSPASIAFAKQFENETLSFKEHDMCIPLAERFDAVFNLFTSFGYFETENDNIRTIKAIKEELKPGGYGVIDFLNSHYVATHLVESEIKVVDGITFHIERKIKNNYILKHISFSHQGTDYNFTEKVKALTLVDFKSYFKKAGVTLHHCFGDYTLSPFHKETSQRLILIFG
ncbi:class I SAM-dependent methyltransferase [Jejudonia soesokkakensis]|uniref:Class I SAM-dependent methyltransferase n=1 Tax=Jejudonia soesokkakensis TaxID=1323432 RepID=A0ABW2MUY0_9FLAO